MNVSNFEQFDLILWHTSHAFTSIYSLPKYHDEVTLTLCRTNVIALHQVSLLDE